MDSTGFEELYRACWKRVFAICYHYTRDQSLAADLAQNVFEMAWKKRSMLSKGTHLDRYLYRSARLEAQSYCRTIANRRQLLKEKPDLYSNVSNTTEELVLYQNLKERVMESLAGLPPKSQQIYLLHEEGMDNKSIAGSMSISEKNVEYHLYKVLSFLRGKIVR